MVRQDKSRGGRITPKAGEDGGVVSREPVRLDRPIDRFIPIIMAVALLAGTLVILVNYIFLADPDNLYLLGGLGLILVGIVAATQWR